MRIIIFILFLFVSCISEEDLGFEYVLDVTPINNLDFIKVSEIDIIQMEMDSNFIIGDVDKIIKKDSLYYILDANRAKGIYRFDKYGYANNYYNKEGRSGDEYLDIEDFDIDNDEVIILCYPGKIIITDLELNFKESFDLKDIYDCIAFYQNNIYLYSYEKNQITIFDREKEETSIIYNGINMIGLITSYRSTFHKVNDGLYFQSTHSFDIYQIVDKDVLPFIELCWADKWKVKKFYSSNHFEDITINQKLKYPEIDVVTLWKNEDDIYIIYSHCLAFGCVVINMKTKLTKQYLIDYIPGLDPIFIEGRNLITASGYYTYDVDMEYFSSNEEFNDVDIRFLNKEGDNPYIIVNKLR